MIDDSVRIFGYKERLHLGNGSRIDAFCVITVGELGIWIGENVHIGAGVYLFGMGGRIAIGNSCSLSPRSTIYTATDDMAKSGLIGACNPLEQRNIKIGDVAMEDYSALGTGAVICPGVTIGEGAVVGAMALVKTNVPKGAIVVSFDRGVAGVNQRIIGYRSSKKT